PQQRRPGPEPAHPAGRAAGRHWLLALALALWALAGWARPPTEVQHVERAVVQIGDAAARAVALPDTWAQRDVEDLRSIGRYRLEFALQALPDESMALMFTRLSTRHSVRVNGELVSGLEQTPSGSNPGLPNPAL